MAKGNKNSNQSKTAAAVAVEKKAAAAPPQEVVAVPGFFGHVIQPGQKLLWANEVEEFCLQLNSAALGATVTAGRSTLFVLAKESKIALCTLIPESNEQYTLSHTFTPLDGEIEFVVEGVNAIHLTGFIDVQEEDDEEEGDHHDFDGECDSCDDEGHGHGSDSDDSMDDEEEMMVFGDQSDSDDDDEEEGDDEDAEGRFEVIEERVHGDAAPKKKEDKKPSAASTKASPKEDKKPAAKKETPAKKEAAAAAAAPAKEIASATPIKKEIAAAAKTEKKIADKVTELTASATSNKKRAAPSESVDVPKKAKNSKREYKGVTIEEHAVGKGPTVMKGRKVSILYKGRLENGKQFDANQNRKKPFSFRHGIGDVIKGMDIGIEGMRSGGKRTILIPSKLGYGKAGAGPSIPGNANLIFDIELL